MMSRAAFAAILTLTLGIPACGKYGPPERTVVPQEPQPRPWVTQPVPQVPQVPEETIPEPTDFDEAPGDEEPAP
jgi:hypothetical protein